MQLNKVIPTIFVLEVTMILIHASSSIWDRHPTDVWIDWIDGIFLAWIPVNLCYTIGWACFLSKHVYTRRLRLFRYYQAIVITILGGLLIWTTFPSRSAEDVECITITSCAAFELRIIVGIIALGDACLHLIRPTVEAEVGLAGQKPSFQCPMEDDLPSYEAPPSYADVERGLQQIQTDSSEPSLQPCPRIEPVHEVNHI